VQRTVEVDLAADRVEKWERQAKTTLDCARKVEFLDAGFVLAGVERAKVLDA